MPAPYHNDDDFTTVDDLQDRLIDRGLSEILGNDSPPDLTARIMADSFADRRHKVERRVTAVAPRSRWLSVVVAATLLVGVTTLLATNGFQFGRMESEQARIRRLAQVPDTPNGRTGAPLTQHHAVIAASPATSSTAPAAIAPTADNQMVLDLTMSTVDENLAKDQNAEPFDPNLSLVIQQTQQLSQLKPQTRSRQLARHQQGQVDVRYSENGSVWGYAGERGQKWPKDKALDASGTTVVGAAAPAATPSPYYLTDDVQYGAPAATSRISGQDGQVSELQGRLDVPFRQNSFVVEQSQSVEQSQNVEQVANTRNDVMRESNPLLLSYRGESLALAKRLSKSESEIDSRGLRGFDWQDQKQTTEGTGPGNPGDQYTRITENPFIIAEGGAAVSTFSIDVDTASYANVRQFLTQMNQLPPPDAVRIEELINYFDYDYAGPAGSPIQPPAEPGADDAPATTSNTTATPPAPGSAGGSSDNAPFAAHVEIAGCPWQPEHRLVRIGIKGREMDRDKRPKSNLVFLVDVSGSMDEPNKLPLVVEGLQLLTRELGENDRVAIVVYASSEGLVLPSTRGDQQKDILEALGRLQAGGSTAGGAGIQLAYKIAEDNFIEGGTNRVILCTDGDFNVGVTSTAELERLCEQKAKDTKVFLSVLGFGRGNLNDAMMEAISNRGNGNYAYVDNRTEACRVLVNEMTGTLVTIAKDVKIQVEFNPQKVAGYRLIGYENRMLRTEDFNDDKKDAGEIGAGHTVTALYEIVPAGKKVDVAPVDGLKYQPQPTAETKEAKAAPSDELLTLKIRYKAPEGDTSQKLEWPVTDDGKAFSAATPDFQFATAAAGFGLMLRDSQYKGNLTYGAVMEVAQPALGEDKDGYRAEFVELVRKAKELRHE